MPPPPKAAKAQGSTIRAGGNVTIVARSDDQRDISGNINSTGTLIESGVGGEHADGKNTDTEGAENKGDITLIADNDINLNSVENLFESDSDDGSASSTTYSVLSEGAIVVRDNPDFSRDNLKTSTEEAHQGLERIFGTDKVQDIQDEVQFQQLASQEMPKVVGDYAKSQTDLARSLMAKANSESDPDKAQALRDEAQEINSKWDEHGTHRLTLHTLTGVLSGDVMGGVGSLAVAVSTPALANALDDMGIKGPLRDSILLATSAAVGGAANGTTGAMNTTGQTANNFLNHEKGEIEALVDELLECQTEECQKDVAERYQELSDQNLQGLIVACGQESADCANDTRLQDEGFSIYEQYREELANSDQDTGIAVNILMAFQLEYGDEMTAGQEAHLETLAKEAFPDATPDEIATIVAMVAGVGKTGGNGKKTNVAGSGGSGKAGSSSNGAADAEITVIPDRNVIPSKPSLEVVDVDTSRVIKGSPEYDILNTPPANKHVKLSDGKSFKTNEHGQVEEVTFIPVDQKVPRDPRQTVVGKEGLEADVGGHVQACSQGGTCDRFNLFPQDRNFNVSAYRTFYENKISKALKNGQTVGPTTVKFTRGDGSQVRPDELKVSFTIDGKKFSQTFENKPNEFK